MLLKSLAIALSATAAFAADDSCPFKLQASAPPEGAALPDIPALIEYGPKLFVEKIPSLMIPRADGTMIDISKVPGRVVLFLFPGAGIKIEDMRTWLRTPGAAGCTGQVCAIRDARLSGGWNLEIFAMSTQTPEELRALADRVTETDQGHLGSIEMAATLLSDASLQFANEVGIQTFQAAGSGVVFPRTTLVIEDGIIIDQINLPFPPHEHVLEVLEMYNHE